MKSNKKFSKSLLSKSITLLLAGAVAPAFAFVEEIPKEKALEVIEVRGIRSSMQESMSVKRDSVGVVDAISAEDIGKFPDTNLAESLQRITGVSISRNNGEGAEVTVRGFGGDKNMITLNGRVMPAADAFSNTQGTTRAFNFANLASESVSSVEVYKTSRANIATGGIGATINIDTAKPLATDGLQFSIGAKAVNDSTNRTGDDVTPEVSGLFSYTNDDATWGVLLTASHQERHSGSTSATVNDWRVAEWTGEFDNISIARGPNGEESNAYKSSQITNTPAIGQLFGQPNDVRYVYEDQQRVRDNAQLTLQFSPNDSFVGTLDYTFAQNKIDMNRGEKVHWMTRTEDNVTFDTGQPVATAVIINESTGGTKDLGFNAASINQLNTLESLGVNFEYELNDNLMLRFDAHNSSMKSDPNSPIAGANHVQTQVAAPVDLTQRHDFRFDLPKVTDTIDDSAKGNNNGILDAGDLGSQRAQIYRNFQETEISQYRFEGTYAFDEGHFDFGVEIREEEMHQEFSENQLVLGDWGVNNPGDIPAGLFESFDVVGEFEDYDTSDISNVGFRAPDTLAVTRWGTDKYGHALAVKNTLDEDHTVREETTALYFQVALEAEISDMPVNILAGVRYESTDVDSSSIIATPTANRWEDNNDFFIERGRLQTLAESNSYDQLLPSLDFDIAITDKLKGRFSFSQTIARANYNQLRTAVTNFNQDAPTLRGGASSADASNPGLIPLKSNNFDLSAEYYFADTSYVSIGFYEKRVSNFIGTKQETETHFGLRDVTAGPRAQAASDALTSGGFTVDETALFVMTSILDNPADFPGGAVEYSDNLTFAEGIAATYDINPNADDPETEYLTSRPVNNEDALIYGFEIAAQHFFGDTGFGVAANYTTVRGDIGFDVTGSPSVSQFALTGLSDTANLVLMYENHGIQARIAYNWRDEYLAETSRGSSRNPRFVESFAQIDANIGYQVNDNLSISLEGINLTGENSRSFGRSKAQMWDLFELGARYQLGARYTF
jgi:TonB-dependent receptor